MRRKGRKRLSLDIPEGFHDEMKEWAKLYNITLTRFVLRAIVEYLKKLRHYQ